MMKKMHNMLLVAGLSLVSFQASAAEWQIDTTHSKLNFMSIKKINVAENHQFHQFNGTLNSNGKLTVNIDLSSVDTGVAIRDERLKKFFFNVAKYADATFSAQINPAVVDELKLGDSAVLSVDGLLSLHGESKPLALDVMVTKVADNKLLVVSDAPVLLHVEDYNLVKGVDKLRELAKLPSISHVVPVSFYLTLNAEK